MIHCFSVTLNAPSNRTSTGSFEHHFIAKLVITMSHNFTTLVNNKDSHQQNKKQQQKDTEALPFLQLAFNLTAGTCNITTNAHLKIKSHDKNIKSTTRSDGTIAKIIAHFELVFGKQKSKTSSIKTIPHTHTHPYNEIVQIENYSRQKTHCICVKQAKIILKECNYFVV